MICSRALVKYYFPLQESLDLQFFAKPLNQEDSAKASKALFSDDNL